MDANLRNNATHVLVLLVLLIALLTVLVFTGLLSCNVVPSGCDIFYAVFKGGQPVVLIAHGEEGMGDYKALESILGDRSILSTQVRTLEIDRLTYGNVKDYDLIIVTQAKQICSTKLKVFEYYVNNGGRLIWTGDAGTELCGGETQGEKYPQNDSYLLESERFENGTEKIIGPWARKDYNEQLSFDEFLGVNYKGNYCEFADCKGEAGYIESVSTDHKLVYGLSPSLPFEGNFAIVEMNKDSTTRLVAVLDYGTKLLAEAGEQPWLEKGKQYNFGEKLPFIVSSQVGERVAYYAAPLETIYNQPQKYKAIIEQAYFGMLFK